MSQSGGITIGQMRDRVSLQAPARPSADPYGQRQPAFATAATVWAKVRQAGGQETPTAQLQREVVTYTVTIRYHPGLNSAWQVLLGDGTTLSIKAVTNPDGVKRFHEITGTTFGTGAGV